MGLIILVTFKIILTLRDIIQQDVQRIHLTGQVSYVADKDTSQEVGAQVCLYWLSEWIPSGNRFLTLLTLFLYTVFVFFFFLVILLGWHQWLETWSCKLSTWWLLWMVDRDVFSFGRQTNHFCFYLFVCLSSLIDPVSCRQWARQTQEHWNRGHQCRAGAIHRLWCESHHRHVLTGRLQASDSGLCASISSHANGRTETPASELCDAGWMTHHQW